MNTGREATNARLSGGTERKSEQRGASRVHVYNAVCTSCGERCSLTSPTQRGARIRARDEARWTIWRDKVGMFGGGQTRVWRVRCPPCAANKNGAPSGESAP